MVKGEKAKVDDTVKKFKKEEGITLYEKPTNFGQKLTKVVSNMLLRGVVKQKDGINYMWNNPFIFFPSESFAEFCFKLLASGNEVSDFFYWLGLLQGRNSTRMMKNRFGLSGKDLASFIDGATIIGMGNLELKRTGKDYVYGDIFGTDSTFALSIKKINNQNKFPVDFYLAGILAGGAEILFNKPYSCIEKECQSKGDKLCYYYLEADKKFESSILKNKLKKLLEVESKITSRYLSRQAFFKVSVSKVFDFKDGAFYLNGLKGYNFECYLVVLMDVFFKENYPKEYENALNVLFSKNLSILFKNQKLTFSSTNLRKVLDQCKILGYGNLIVKNFSSTDSVFIEINNNPLAEQYKEIFGVSKNYQDYQIIILLKMLFLKIFNKKVEITEINCLAQNNNSCLFKIKL